MDQPERSTRSLDCRVLGATELLLDGAPIDVGGYRQRRLLAVLLARASSVVDTSALAEYVWDDADRPLNADRAIRTYISRLRRSLAAAGLDAAQIVATQAPGYRFEAVSAPGVDVILDADRFADLISSARSDLAVGEPRLALRDIDMALAIWRGTPYQEFADQVWASGEVARLVELRSVAREERAALRLELGAHAEVAAELEQQVGEDPLRARPVELLMRALFRSSRQADALRAAASYRRALGDIGLDPAQSVVDVESSIATSDESVGLPRRPPGNLPHPSSSFCGRLEDVVRFSDELEATRLLTLTGPGGVGKTRLAMEVAARAADSFDDGVWFVALADVDADRQVAPRLAAALSVNDWSDQPVTVITRRLGRGRSLLLLDNCEHVIDGVATVAETLIEHTGATLLCTSREGLGVDGETLRPVGPLDVGAARELLITRAGDAGAAVDPDDPAIDDICARLDGLPLAIELAAARVRGIGLSRLGRALEGHLQLLAGRRRRIDRHRTIRATIDWSHDLLDEGEQIVFRRLAMFAGGFTLPGAEFVASFDDLDQLDMVEAVGGLVDKSMLITFAGRSGLRYRLLEPIRQQARERLVAAGEAEAVECCYIEWIVRRWTDLASRLESTAEPAAVPEATDEWDNLIAAADQAARRGDLGSTFELIWTTRRFAIYRGGFDVVSWAAPILDRSDAAAASGFAEAAVLVAVGLTRRGEYDAAEVLIDRALTARTERPDEVGWRASMVRGFVESGGRGDLTASLPHYRGVLSFALSPADEAIQRANLSSLLSTVDPDEARGHADAVHELVERHQLPPSQRALVLALLGLGAQDPEQVRRLCGEAVDLADLVGATWPGGLARGELFRVAVLHGEPLDAFAMLRAMLPDLLDGGRLIDWSTVVWTAARLLTRLGMHREALLLDDAMSAVGVRTLAVHDPALVALNPDARQFDDDERRRIRVEAEELVGREPGSLRPITTWLLAIEP